MVRTKGTSGIYQIRNLINDKRYIGSAVNLKQRKFEHLSGLNMKNHKNPHLQHAWDKHGKCNFIFEILLCCKKQDLLLEEQKKIDFYKNLTGIYNIALIAGSNLGRTFSKSTKLKMSQAAKGHKCSEETKRKIGKKNKGAIRSEEAKHKLSVIRKGQKYSEETKQKMRETQMGHVVTDEVRKKISAAQRQLHKQNPERQLGCKNTFYGKTHSEESKLKMSEAKKGNSNGKKRI